MAPEHIYPSTYLLHTNRELGLMLRGIKPLAVFSWIVGKEIAVLNRYMRMFNNYVDGGYLRKRERISPTPQRPDLFLHEIFYSLPGQDWRVDEYIELLHTAVPWTNARERRLGELLGYEDWQNDIHLGKINSEDNV